MRTIRVLHVASFLGNIGDNANHMGFRSRLKSHLPDIDWRFKELEIRGFYRRQWRFDLTFADLANSHDLVIIGGGNYFELWVANSATGTSIDISRTVLDRIRVPVLFNGLGVDPAQGAPDENVHRFRHFLEHLGASDQFLVSVRNDGSWRALQEHVGKADRSFIHRVPDAGHFAREPVATTTQSGRATIAVNLAGDMLETRFPSPRAEYPRFIDQMSSVLSRLLEEDGARHVVFVPHIFRDLKPIHDVMVAMDDALRRERVSVAPCVQGNRGARLALRIYATAQLTLGMRFHANVCPIGMDVPTVGLDNYRQVREYYRELGRAAWAVDVRQADYSGELLRLATAMIENPGMFHERNRQDLEELGQSIRSFHGLIGEWLAAATPRTPAQTSSGHEHIHTD